MTPGSPSPRQPQASRASGAGVAAKRSAPVLALSIEGACESLGVSWDLWREHIASEVRIVRVGRRRLVPVAELQRWLDEHAEKVLGDR
jgi:excisionase family DNA binding protein